MATSGAATDGLRQLFQGSFAALVSAAESVPAGSGGLLMLPYFAAERTPICDPNARGILAGLTVSHGQAEIYLAAWLLGHYRTLHPAMRASLSSWRLGRCSTIAKWSLCPLKV